MIISTSNFSERINLVLDNMALFIHIGLNIYLFIYFLMVNDNIWIKRQLFGKEYEHNLYLKNKETLINTDNCNLGTGHQLTGPSANLGIKDTTKNRYAEVPYRKSKQRENQRSQSTVKQTILALPRFIFYTFTYFF